MQPLHNESNTSAIATDLFTINRLARAAHTQAWTLPDLTLPQFKTFMVIARMSPTPVSDLVQELDADPSIVSRTVSALVKAGFVDRTADPSDGRKKTITVSEQGRAFLDRLWNTQLASIEALVADFDEDDAAALSPLLHKLLNHMQGDQT